MSLWCSAPTSQTATPATCAVPSRRPPQTRSRNIEVQLCSMARETFQIGDLTAVIGDNEGYDGHRAGYNGVHRLTHRTNPKSLFTVTGLNHEHIFDGDHELRGDT